MNLVAKEYVAAQNTQDPAVIPSRLPVRGECSNAAVNPYDPVASRRRSPSAGEPLGERREPHDDAFKCCAK